MVFSIRTRNNEHELKYIKFHVNIAYDFFNNIILNFYFILRISQKGYGVPSLGQIQNSVVYDPEPSAFTDHSLRGAVALDHNQS